MLSANGAEFIMRVTIEQFIKKSMDAIIICFVFPYALLSKHTQSNLQFTGFILIVLSIYMCIKVKDNKLLLFLFALFGFINISLGYTDCIMLGAGVASWQTIGLRSKIINPISAKSILLTMAIVNLFIDEKVKKSNFISPNELRKSNSVISIGGSLVLLLILVFGLVTQKSALGSYESVSNPIFEYSIIIVCFVWYYSKKLKWVDYFIWGYIVLFSYHFLSIGDRSSVFMLIILVALCYFYEYINIVRISIVILIGVPITNIIAVVRSSGLIASQKLFLEIVTRGLYVDTVSWAYYGGLAVSSLYRIVDDHFNMLLGFIGFNNEYISFNDYATNHYSSLMNAGGGIYPSSFYAIAGFTGVVIGALILGFIMRTILINKKKDILPYKLLLITFVFRWYLYNPSTLFRGILIYTSIVWLICKFIEQIMERKNKLFTKKIKRYV